MRDPTRRFSDRVEDYVRSRPSYPRELIDVLIRERLLIPTEEQKRALRQIARCLAPGGILAYWSAGPDQAFHDRLRRCGFLVEEITVHAHGNKGARHIIWLASIM